MNGLITFAGTLVFSAPVPADSGLTLQVAASAVLPTPPFNATVWPSTGRPTPEAAEIVRVTARVGDVLTIQRAQEGTVAREILYGDNLGEFLTRRTLTDIAAGTAPGAPASGHALTATPYNPAAAGGMLIGAQYDPTP